jgi:hypothetical protein
MTSRLLILGALLVLLVTACSPGSQEEPEAIARRDVPFQLLETTTTTREPPADDTAQRFDVYLVSGDRLVASSRSTDASPTAVSALRALIVGPTTADDQLGIGTAIPPATRLVAVARDAEMLDIDLSREFMSSASDGSLAVGQLVLTATSLPGIERIRFRIDGMPVEVPTGDGALAHGPVTRDDYANLLA